MAEQATRLRAERDDVRRARQALGSVAPFNRQIGLWQGKAARLAALGEKVRARGGYEPDLLLEAEGLVRDIAAQCASFAAVVAGLPPDLAAHGRVLDTKRALATVARQSDRALALLTPAAAPRRGTALQRRG